MSREFQTRERMRLSYFFPLKQLGVKAQDEAEYTGLSWIRKGIREELLLLTIFIDLILLHPCMYISEQF